MTLRLLLFRKDFNLTLKMHIYNKNNDETTNPSQIYDHVNEGDPLGLILVQI